MDHGIPGYTGKLREPVSVVICSKVGEKFAILIKTTRFLGMTGKLRV